MLTAICGAAVSGAENREKKGAGNPGRTGGQPAGNLRADRQPAGKRVRKIRERQAARKAKDFARADEIRGELLARGIVLEDTREGIKWKRV